MVFTGVHSFHFHLLPGPAGIELWPCLLLCGLLPSIMRLSTYILSSGPLVFITILQLNEFAQHHLAKQTEIRSEISRPFSHTVFLNFYDL